MEPGQEKRTLVLLDPDGNYLGNVAYPRWTYNKATAEVADNEYQIKQKSIWTTRFSFSRNQHEVGESKANLSGFHSINFTDQTGKSISSGSNHRD